MCYLPDHFPLALLNMRYNAWTILAVELSEVNSTVHVYSTFLGDLKISKEVITLTPISESDFGCLITCAEIRMDNIGF